MKSVVCAALGLVAANALAAEPCNDNFNVQGNLLTGKTFKTWAVVPAVSREEAFQRAYAFTVANGFVVLSANKEAGAITAAHGQMYAKGKTLPLNIVLQPQGGDVRIDLNWISSTGMMSPESAIRQHFCQTVAAAGTAGTAPAALNASPALANTSAPAPARRTMPGYASPSDTQLQGYQSEITKNVADPKLRAQINLASEAIAEYIGRLACLNDHSGASALNAYAAPGVNLHNRYVGLRPMREMQYHDKGSCLTVSRIQGWKAPANNALQFEVVYKADDSGEIKKLNHEAVRQPDNSWLFTQ